jgi:hypothetical protein
VHRESKRVGWGDLVPGCVAVGVRDEIHAPVSGVAGDGGGNKSVGKRGRAPKGREGLALQARRRGGRDMPPTEAAHRRVTTGEGVHVKCVAPLCGFEVFRDVDQPVSDRGRQCRIAREGNLPLRDGTGQTTARSRGDGDEQVWQRRLIAGPPHLVYGRHIDGLNLYTVTKGRGKISDIL